MYKIALVGLPNAGKSTLFNLLTSSDILTAPYPFSTIKPNKAILRLYDSETEELVKAVGYKDTLLPEVEVWDIAGLIKGAADGEGLGNEFLGYIQQCDLIIHVIGYDSQKETELEASIATIDSEIALFDHKLLLKPFEKARRMSRLYPGDASHTERSRIISKAFYGSKDGTCAVDILTKSEIDVIDDLELITTKPKIILLNDFGSGSKAVHLAQETTTGLMQANLLDLLSIAQLSDNEASELGYSKEQIKQFIKSLTKKFLKLKEFKRFYTVGHLGVGLWFAPIDADLVQCSASLHSEISNDIRGVKVATVGNFIAEKSWAKLAQKGLVKMYGVKYVPKDRDVLLFQVN